jgi:phage gpG-like protein
MSKYAQQKVRIEIPRGYSPEQRQQIGERIIEFIIERDVGLNQNKNSRKYKEYSKEYADEKGTSKSNVTLQDSGDMHANLKVLKTYSNYITIGYDKDYDGMGKVEGNRKGTYGNKKPVTSPRDFLGITKNSLNQILKEFRRDERQGLLEEQVSKEASNLTPAQLKALEG